MRRRLALVLAFCAALLPGVVRAQTHCSQLPPLTPEATFPRVTPRDLAVVGYPDHMHAHVWPTWETPVDSEGRPYGPGSFCNRKELVNREGLTVHADQKQSGKWILRHHPDYPDCDMIQFVELLDWAGHEIPPLLGLDTPDTLTIVNPDNVAHYTELTGQGVWRFYSLEDDRCTMQPWPVLQKRTLEGHAAFMLVADWILRRNVGDELPPWLHQGILEYVSEDGQHLLNYMAEFRSEGDILMSPPLIDALLSGEVNPDPGTDREHYRRACYGAFLMVWELVENQGGLDALQDFLGLAAAGMDMDEAAHRVYGMGLVDLAEYLDPVVAGEPVGPDTVRKAPHRQP